MLKLLLSLFEYYRILCLYLPNQIPRLWSYNIHVNIKFIDNWSQLKRRNTILLCKGKLGCLNRNPTIMLISKWKLCLKLWSIRNQKGMNILEQAGIFVASVVSQVLWSQEDYLESPQKLKNKKERMGAERADQLRMSSSSGHVLETWSQEDPLFYLQIFLVWSGWPSEQEKHWGMMVNKSGNL